MNHFFIMNNYYYCHCYCLLVLILLTKRERRWTNKTHAALTMKIFIQTSLLCSNTKESALSVPAVPYHRTEAVTWRVTFEVMLSALPPTQRRFVFVYTVLHLFVCFYFSPNMIFSVCWEEKLRFSCFMFILSFLSLIRSRRVSPSCWMDIDKGEKQM